MRKLITISTLLFSALSFGCIAGDKVNQTLEANNATNVSIENLRGKVTIIGWDKDEVSVSGEVDDKAEAFIFEQDGAYINVKVKMPRNMRNYDNHGGSDLTVKVPSSMRVDFSGVSSDVSIERIYKSTEVKTVSGEIEIRDAKEQIDLTTVSGDVESQNLNGKIYISTVSGNVRDRQSAGRVKLKTVSGDIDTQSASDEVALSSVSGEIAFKLNEVDELVLSTVSGDIDGHLALNNNGSLKMSSVSGNIDVRFTNDVQASFRMKSNAGGDLRNGLTNDRAQEAKYGPSSKLNFETGNASASVKASTVSGRIKVGK